MGGSKVTKDLAWRIIMKGEENIFVKCTCGVEVFELSYWKDSKHPTLWSTIYTHAGYHTPFFARIREAWNVLKRGVTANGVSAEITEADRVKLIAFLQEVKLND